MKKMITGVAAVALMMTSAAMAEDVAVELTVDVASAYVFRGDTLNDGPVVQPGLEIGLPYGITLGVWGNIDLDDYDGALEKNQFSEIDVYVSYALPLNIDALDVSVGYTEFAYPGAEGKADREVGLAFGYDLGLAELGLGLFYGVDGGIDKDFFAELTVGTAYELPEGVVLDLGAGIGYLNPDEGESGFSGYSLSAGLSYGILSASVTYYGQVDSDVLVDRVVDEDGEVTGTYDVDVVGMLSLALEF